MLTIIKDGQEIQARDHRDPGYFWADNELIEVHLPQIGIHAFSVYMLLAYHSRSKTGRSWPSIKGMAARLGISEPTIRKALETLVQNGLILISDNYKTSKAGKKIPQAYTYTLVAIEKTKKEGGVVKDVDQGGGKPALPGVVKDVDPNKNNINKNKKINTTANPPFGVSRDSNSATTSDPAIQELNANLTTLTTVQENSSPTKTAEEESPSKVPPIVPEPPAAPLKVVEASPMPQNENKAVLAPDSPIQLDAWYVDAPGGVFGPYPSYEAVKRGADELGGRVTQGQAIKDKTITPARQPKAKAIRKPDPVFDAVALGSFGLSKVAGKVGGRIAGLVKEIKECTADEHQATLSADLPAMYEWRKKTYPQLSAPTQGLTICKYLAEWRQSKQPAEMSMQKHYFPDGTYELRAG